MRRLNATQDKLQRWQVKYLTEYRVLVDYMKRYDAKTGISGYVRCTLKRCPLKKMHNAILSRRGAGDDFKRADESIQQAAIANNTLVRKESRAKKRMRSAELRTKHAVAAKSVQRFSMCLARIPWNPLSRNPLTGHQPNIAGIVAILLGVRPNQVSPEKLTYARAVTDRYDCEGTPPGSHTQAAWDQELARVMEAKPQALTLDPNPRP